MKVALSIGGPGNRGKTNWDETVDFICEAERLGVDSVWSAEAWGGDSITPLAFLAARTQRIMLGSGIMQIGTRSPVMMAQSAMTLAWMSKGRFALGLGVSGPQVIEGLHGTDFARPLARLRETVDIIKLCLRGERVTYQGKFFELPRPGGEGKALRLDVPPCPDLPIFLATLGPKSLAFTGEVADGWLGTSFMPEHADAFFGHMQTGLRLSGRSFSNLTRLVAVDFELSDDVERLIDARRGRMAFVLGGMGSANANFYNDAFRRAGYEDAAAEVQALWVAGRHDEARARVPDELVLKNHLIGSADMIRERLKVYRDCGVDGFRLNPAGTSNEERLTSLGRAIDLIPASSNS